MAASYRVLALSTLVTLLSCVAAQNQSTSNCTVFDWNQQPGYIVNGTTFRVSAASTCEAKQNKTQNCPITAIGDQDAQWSTNISRILPDGYWNSETGAQSFLHNLILNAVNQSLNGASWENYVIGVVDTTQALPPGTSGYINFTIFSRCFEGSMGNCTGGLEDGLGIRACAPVITPIRDEKALPFLDGVYAVVEIPEEDVSQYGNPYRGLARGGASGRNSNIGGAMVAFVVILVTIFLVL